MNKIFLLYILLLSGLPFVAQGSPDEFFFDVYRLRTTQTYQEPDDIRSLESLNALSSSESEIINIEAVNLSVNHDLNTAIFNVEKNIQSMVYTFVETLNKILWAVSTCTTNPNEDDTSASNYTSAGIQPGINGRCSQTPSLYSLHNPPSASGHTIHTQNQQLRPLTFKQDYFDNKPSTSTLYELWQVTQKNITLPDASSFVAVDISFPETITMPDWFNLDNEPKDPVTYNTARNVLSDGSIAIVLSTPDQSTQIIIFQNTQRGWEKIVRLTPQETIVFVKKNW